MSAFFGAVTGAFGFGGVSPCCSKAMTVVSRAISWAEALSGTAKLVTASAATANPIPMRRKRVESCSSANIAMGSSIEITVSLRFGKRLCA